MTAPQVGLRLGRILVLVAAVWSAAVPQLRADDCACVPSDFDQDGDVDMSDFGHLQACLSGTGVTQSDPACAGAKLAGHTYVDQVDVELFRACMAGDHLPYAGTSLPSAVISEFMCANDEGLADEDGDYPDWIEVYNPCRPMLNLNGWYLTDDAGNLQKWVFPAVTLARGERLVIFASGKDRRNAAARLHTNFQLEKDGEFLALVAADGQTIVQAYGPQYPPQHTNISYGLLEGSTQTRYFATPTPGQPNTAGAVDLVEPVAFDAPRGFRAAPFALTLTSPTAGATIRYTLDGSTPTESNGTVYAGPVTISGTSTVRAAAFKTSWLASATVTNTYLFVSDVVQQSLQGQKPGTAWPNPGTVNGQILDYGMDPDVLNDPRYSGLVDDALLAIPSISLVTDLPNLFGTATGIYTNAGNDGEEWERACSVELLNPDGTPGFQIDAGLRIRGGWSRADDCPKHGFRLFFRSKYGQKELEYPLFGSEGADHFKKIDLRTEQDYSWSFTGDTRCTMVREVFSRDTEAAMGEPYTRSRYYHIYIDGQYWGIYQTEERPEADYAATYFGGQSSDYDVIKVDWGAFTIYATNGDINAWQRLWNACQVGFAANANYLKVQGLNPDGTRNPAYEVLLDVDSTIDCALITYYIGDIDGPTSEVLGNGVPNNFYVLRNRDGQSGFKCFKHDAEMAMLDVNENRIGPWSAGNQFQYSNPQYLSECLMNNAEYRLRFADRVQKFMFNGGPLTPASAAARFMARASQIQTAIIAESARWGDAKTSVPRNRDSDWWPEINWVVNSYLPVRTGNVLDQLKAKGLYPTVPAPQFSNYGGQVQAGYGLILSKPAGTSGTIYYTTDGSDPRLLGGAVAAGAQVFVENSTSAVLIPAGAVWRYLDTGSEQAGWTTTGFADAGWALGAAQLGYSPDEGDEVTTVSYGTDANNKHVTTWFRKSFVAPAGVNCTSLTLSLLCDDGAAVYLNGHTPVTTSTMPGSWNAGTLCSCVSAENVFVNYAMDPAFLNVGNTNVLAVEVHQCALNSTDLSFDMSLTGTIDSSQPVVIDHNMTVKARILSNGVWSALVEATFVTQPVGLVINEFQADNATTLQDPDEPGEYPDWIEIYNANNFPVSMAGMYLTDDFTRPTKFRIAEGISIPANGYVVFWADDDGTQGNLHTNFSLSKNGEQIRLMAADGTTVIDEVVFGAQTADVAYGRSPDGGATWGQMVTPTPGAANGAIR